MELNAGTDEAAREIEAVLEIPLSVAVITAVLLTVTTPAIAEKVAED